MIQYNTEEIVEASEKKKSNQNHKKASRNTELLRGPKGKLRGSSMDLCPPQKRKTWPKTAIRRGFSRAFEKVGLVTRKSRVYPLQSLATKDFPLGFPLKGQQQLSNEPVVDKRGGIVW